VSSGRSCTTERQPCAPAGRRQGIVIDWRRHLRTGLPVTVVALAITAAWFGWRAGALST
jgi:hypothetical protein